MSSETSKASTVVQPPNMTLKQMEERYIGKPFHENDASSRVSKVVSVKQNDGARTAALLSGGSGDYAIEAIIDISTGRNVIPGRSRFAESIGDAKDVAMEMYEDIKR